jgi:hypothetical protein
VPVTMTARITSTWRSVIIYPKPQACGINVGPPAFGLFSCRRTKQVDPPNTKIGRN